MMFVESILIVIAPNSSCYKMSQYLEIGLQVIVVYTNMSECSLNGAERVSGYLEDIFPF